jgi:hypothetical protein
MELDQYINELERCWPQVSSQLEPTEATLQLAQRAVQEYPTSAKLWIIRGNLLELANFDTSLPLREPMRCYRAAIKIDPLNIEAHEDLAWFVDAVLGNRRKAKRFFDKARRLRRRTRAAG